MTILRRTLATGSAGVLMLIATGCGSGTVGDSSGETGDGASKGGAISVDTASGPVELDGPAKKVVTLEWTYAEELVALGVTPTGNADNKGYSTWVTAKGAELPGKVTDVGDRNEPSLEKIKALDPDLIVIDSERSKSSLKQLEKIAPVLSFTYTTKPQLKTMKKNFTELAKAVGKEDKAAEVNKRIDTTASDLKRRLTKADKGGTTFALAQGSTANGVASIRMLNDDAIGAQLLKQAGLKNGWTAKGDVWGLSTVGVEGLTKTDKDATFLYVAADADNPFAGDLAKNPVWKGLPFVKNDQVRPLDPGTWLFGGPLSSIQILEETGKALKV